MLRFNMRRANIFANLHDGDIYRDDLIGKWKQALDEFPSASFVFNAYEVIAVDGSRSIARETYEGKLPRHYIARHHFRTMTSCVWGTVMTRADAYSRAGHFDPAFGFISDVDMWLRLSRDADVAYVNEPLITLTPRELTHPFAYHSWQHLFWQFAIYKKHLSLYRDVLPEGVEHWEQSFAELRRKKLFRAMLSLIKHHKWDRVKEGLAVWRGSDDAWLRIMGKLTSRESWQQPWYDKTKWQEFKF